MKHHQSDSASRIEAKHDEAEGRLSVFVHNTSFELSNGTLKLPLPTATSLAAELLCFVLMQPGSKEAIFHSLYAAQAVDLLRDFVKSYDEAKVKGEIR